MAKKEEICDLCSEQKYIAQKLKDGTKMCSSCELKISNGFTVNWNRLTKYDFHYFDEIPTVDDNFNPDFEFKGFKADTKLGVFKVSHHEQLFELKSIRKYYIKFIHTTSTSSDEYYTTVTGAKLIIELDHPVVFSVKQTLSQEKHGFLGELFLEVVNVAAKLAYEKHNDPLLKFLKEQTGKRLSLSKKEVH